MAKLVYTISIGHSGSTLLDLLLGSVRGIFATGALNCIMWQWYRNSRSDPSVDSEDICTCLHSFHDCPAWSSIIQTLSKKTRYDVAKQPMKFRIPLMRHQCWGHDSFFRDLDHKVYRRMLLKNQFYDLAPLYHWKYRKTIQNNWMLIDAIGDTMGVQYVSDSSKDFVRMNLLRSRRPSEVIVVLLIRELYGVANSYLHGLGSRRVNTFDLGDFCDGYVQFYNHVAAFCMDHGIEPIIVKYKDLTSDPAALRRSVANRLGLAAGNVLRLDTRESHLVAGNPMRYRGAIEIHHDDKWKRELSDRQRAVIDDKINNLDAIYTSARPESVDSLQAVED